MSFAAREPRRQARDAACRPDAGLGLPPKRVRKSAVASAHESAETRRFGSAVVGRRPLRRFHELAQMPPAAYHAGWAGAGAGAGADSGGQMARIFRRARMVRIRWNAI